MLPVWQEKHTEFMIKLDTFEKPIDHVDNRYFMMSKKGDTILEVKFKMYFHMKIEPDLLYVLELCHHTLGAI
jgi:hypothetical protein